MNANQNHTQTTFANNTQTHLVVSAKRTPAQRQFELGQAIARMYLSAQNVSSQASAAALTAMNGASSSCRQGFRSVIDNNLTS